MKRNLLFALGAVMIGALSLLGVISFEYFYPKNYVKNDSGEYVNITTAGQQSTFPVTKATIFNVQYSYPDEDRILTEQLKYIPALLGCDKEGVEKYLDNYMEHLSKSEQEAGLVSYEMIAYHENEITLRKTFRKVVKDGFFAKSFNGSVVILNGDEKTVYEYTQISLEMLPEDLREQVLEGYYMENEGELYSFLENYSS